MSRIEEAILKLKARGQQADRASEQATSAVASGDTRSGTPPSGASVRIAPANVLPAATARHAPARSVTVTLEHLRAEGLLPPMSDERRIANEFRAIKRALVGNVTGRAGEPVPNANVIMVASAMPGEGKTFSAVNLALSLALEKDFNVVLVDADVAKPNISRVFGVADERGLLDVLGDDSLRFNDVEIGTNLSGLSIVPAGRRQETAAELLSSARMVELVAEMVETRDCLYVFDSTPLLLTNESRVLAEIAGQVVLIVRAGVTPQPAVESALEQIPDGRYVGLVLNQRRNGGPANYYGYGYGDYGS